MTSAHTTAGDHDSNHQTLLALAEEQYWSSLPDDLLGEVNNRLAGPLSRVRFAATCTSWHATASARPPPRALP
jgi:hypothetical protein